MSPIRIVCFDWGGVILKISRSWRDRFERAGYSPNAEVLSAENEVRLYAVAEEYQCGRLSSEDYFASMASLTHGQFSPTQMQAVHDAWLIGEYDRVGDVIDTLNAKDTVRTGMLSNTNAAHWARQHDGPGGFPSASRIQLRLASHELGFAKPDRAIFDAAVERFGVFANEILYFDDLPEYVAAARSAGWNAERIDHEGDTANQMRTHLIARGILRD